jgi:hypothetical protein
MSLLTVPRTYFPGLSSLRHYPTVSRSQSSKEWPSLWRTWTSSSPRNRAVRSDWETHSTDHETELIDDYLYTIIGKRALNVPSDLRRTLVDCKDSFTRPELRLQPPVFLSKDFDYSTIIGKAECEIGNDIDSLFSSSQCIHVLYRPRGSGKSVMCERLRHMCWKKNILPVSLNFATLDNDHWDNEFYDYVRVMDRPRAFENGWYFALATTARILYDRYQFDSLNEVCTSMKDNRHCLKTYIQEKHDPEYLTERTVCAVRHEAGGIRYNKVLVLADNCNHITDEWLFDIQIKEILNLKPEHSPAILMGMSRGPFTGLGWHPLAESKLDPVDIRDKWLKLHIPNQDKRDATTRLLTILAPLPNIITSVKQVLQRPPEDKAVPMAEVYRSAQLEFMKTFSHSQANALNSISFQTLQRLVFARGAKVHPPAEPIIFLLAQVQTNEVQSRRAKILLNALQHCSNKVIEAILKEGLSGDQYVNHVLKALFAEWLDVRVQCALLGYKVSFSLPKLRGLTK